MNTSLFTKFILAIVLPSLRISPLLRIAAIVLFYTVVISSIILYIQSIGSGVGIFSELFISSLVLIRPKLEVKRHKLTKAEQSQFTLSADLKDILVGLILGDLYIQKSKGCVNPTLRFEQGLVHEDYLFPAVQLTALTVSCF